MRPVADDVQVIVTQFVLSNPHLHSAIPDLLCTSLACHETVMKWRLARTPLDITRPPPESLWWFLPVRITKTRACASMLHTVSSVLLERLPKAVDIEFYDTADSTPDICQFLTKYTNFAVNLVNLTINDYLRPSILYFSYDLYLISIACPNLQHFSISDSQCVSSHECSEACNTRSSRMSAHESRWPEYNDMDKRCINLSTTLPRICNAFTNPRTLNLACFLPLDCSDSIYFPATLDLLLNEADSCLDRPYRQGPLCVYHDNVTHHDNCASCRARYAETMMTAQFKLVHALGSSIPTLESLTILTLFHSDRQTKQLRYWKTGGSWAHMVPRNPMVDSDDEEDDDEDEEDEEDENEDEENEDEGGVEIVEL